MIGQWQDCSGEPLDIERSVTQVGQRRRHGQDIVGGIKCKADGNGDLCNCIGQGDSGTLAGALNCAVRRLEGPVTTNPMGLQSRFPKPALSQTGHKAERLIEIGREAWRRTGAP